MTCRALVSSLVAALAITAAGCRPGASYHAPEGLKLPEAATLKVRSKVNPFETSPITILKIDGKLGPEDSEYGGKWGNLLLSPGPHVVRVAYNNGNRYSIHAADITFTATAGKVYEVFDWPPVLADVTEPKVRRAVKHEMKIAPRD